MTWPWVRLVMGAGGDAKGASLGTLSTQGPMGGNRQKQFRCFLVFPFVYCIFGFYGVLIIPKWLIEVPGHIPILFGIFLELPKM